MHLVITFYHIEKIVEGKKYKNIINVIEKMMKKECEYR